MFFFFKQKTAYEMRISDWSSDVCSSDLSLSFYAIVRRPHFGCCHALISASSTQPRSRAASGRPAIERGRRGGQSTEDGSVASRRAHAPHSPRACDRALSGRPSRRRGDAQPRWAALDRPTFRRAIRSEEHTSELQSLMRISYAVFCLKNKTK